MIQQQIVKEKHIIFSLLLFAFISSFFGTMSSPFYPMNYWVDPNAYFTMAKSWLNGYLPYKDLFDHKGPALYVIYAIGCLISDTSFAGMYIVQSLALFIVSVYIYKMALLFIPQFYSYLTTLCSFLIFFCCNHLGGTAEELIIPFQAISLYLFLKHFINKENPSNLRYSFIHGIFIGIVALIKFNLIVFWFFPLAAIFIQYIIDKQYKKALLYTVYTALGIIIVFIPFIIYYYLVGALPDLIYSYITFNSIYASLNFDWTTIMWNYWDSLLDQGILIITLFLGSLYLCFFAKNIRNFIFKIAFIFSAYVSFLLMLAGYFSLYNLIHLFIICPIGIVMIFAIINRKFNPKVSTGLYGISFVILLALSIFIKKDLIMDANKSNYVNEFTGIILKDKDKTFMKIGLDGGFYLSTNSYPDFKYYYNPNISYETYPLIIDSQKEYIKNSRPNYLIIEYGDDDLYYSYFKDFIKDTYTFVQEGYAFENENYKYYLFKRNFQ